MIHNFLPVDFVSQLLKSVRLLENGIVDFEGADAEIIEGLEKLAIKVELYLTIPLVVAFTEVMNNLIRLHLINVAFNYIVMIDNQGLLVDLIATNLVAAHIHVQAQVCIQSDQSDTSDVAKIVNEFVEHLRGSWHHHG